VAADAVMAAADAVMAHPWRLGRAAVWTRAGRRCTKDKSTDRDK
jgi:hypothetical protein